MKIESSLPEATIRLAMNGDRQRLQQNVYILFVGLSEQEVSPILAILKQVRLIPRSKNIHNPRQFARALSERSWDLIISQHTAKDISAKHVQQMVQRLDKDIPIIQLVTNNTRQANILGIRDGMAAVASLAETELLLLQIHQQLQHLDRRKQVRQLEALLAEAEKNNQKLAENSRSAIIYLNLVMAPIFSNDACHELLAIDGAHILQRHGLLSFISPDHHNEFNNLLSGLQHRAGEGDSIELTGRRSDGTLFKTLLEVKHSRFENQDCIQLAFKPDGYGEAETLENIDTATRLRDKHFLLDKLEMTAQRALLGGADANLLYIRLDNYHDLQDTLQQGSDIMMAELATLFRDKVSQTHTCARLEKDVFAILYQDANLDKTMRIAELIRKAIIKAGKNIAGTGLNIQCSIGITGINDNTPHYLELIDRAEEAANAALDADKNGISFYQAPAKAAEDQTDEAVDLIRDAMVEDSFSLHFQPIVSLRANKGIGNYEVLLRLQDEDNADAISPSDFIASLDSPTTSVRLDKWVIEHSLRKIHEGLSNDLSVRLFINLTLSSLQSQPMLTWLRQTLNEEKIPAKLICLQISEADIRENQAAAAKFIHGIRKLGCKICIKHFGISDDSDRLCTDTKPDLVKLDQKYLNDINQEGKTNPAFTDLIKQLNKDKIACIAPMVEDTRMLSRLWQAGVPFIQGYYLQPPKPEMEYDFFD
ncbi:EAL domain-containing protein [Aliamphritea hakodatensis]|uniref:EAL domain-containing protein n=1 Tax=Aliamphritea hakodatensis TaxID=2895352 RepID=UPI0022FD7458|nr:EAL domain-containing protein [Aliamphritea hakodatensis]